MRLRPDCVRIDGEPGAATWFFAAIGFLGTLVLPSLYGLWNSGTHRLVSAWISFFSPFLWVKAHLGWPIYALFVCSMAFGAIWWIGIGSWLIFRIFVKPLVTLWRVLGIFYLVGGLVLCGVLLGLSAKTNGIHAFWPPGRSVEIAGGYELLIACAAVVLGWICYKHTSSQSTSLALFGLVLMSGFGEVFLAAREHLTKPESWFGISVCVGTIFCASVSIFEHLHSYRRS